MKAIIAVARGSDVSIELAGNFIRSPICRPGSTVTLEGYSIFFIVLIGMTSLYNYISFNNINELVMQYLCSSNLSKYLHANTFIFYFFVNTIYDPCFK